jgi:hypothetical protein
MYGTTRFQPADELTEGQPPRTARATEVDARTKNALYYQLSGLKTTTSPVWSNHIRAGKLSLSNPRYDRRVHL